MKTVTTTQASAQFSVSVDVALRHEQASEFADAVVAKKLLDNTGYLKQASEQNTLNITKLCQDKQIPLIGRGGAPGGLFGEIIDGYGRSVWVQNEALTNPTVRFSIGDVLPRGCKIMGFGAIVKGGPAHSNLPTTMPTVRLEIIDAYAPLGTAAALISEVTDTTSDVNAYQNSHKIEKTTGSLIEYVIQEKIFQLVIRGETGDNAKTGLSVLSIYIWLET